MTATIENLKNRIAHLQEELAEIHAALDELPDAPPDKGATSDVLPPYPPAGVQFADPRALLPLLDMTFADLGVNIAQQAPTAEEVQRMLLREGVRPEDKLLSRGIVEAREE